MNLTDRRAGCWIAAAAMLLSAGAGSAQSPEGKVIADVIPQGNRVIPNQEIFANLMRLKPGSVFKQQYANEDTARLNSTKAFATIEIYTRNLPPPDDRV